MATTNSDTTEQMRTRNSASIVDFLKESALVLAGITALLYLWGLTGDIASLFLRGVPFEFIPQRSVQEYVVTGSLIALLLFLPLAIIVRTFLLFFPSPRSYFQRLRARSPVDAALLLGLMLLLSVLLIFPFAELLDHLSNDSRLKVKMLRTRDATKVACPYQELYFAARTDKAYILVDRLTKDARVCVVSMDGVAELVIEREK